MLEAITPGDNIYNYRYNLQKKSNISLNYNNQYRKINALPVIKTFKDQMTATEDIRTCFNFNNSKIRNVNETTLLFNLIKNDNSPTTISNNLVTNNINKINSNFFYNRNNKLKSIPQKKLTKSNSSTYMNPIKSINSNKSFTVLNFPGNNFNPMNNKKLKHSFSQPKFGITQEYFEKNKCNFLMLKYTGIDNSKNEIKKKKYLLINPHKVINSLKNYSMPNDVYGTKLIDVIQQRINSGSYHNYRFNFSHQYQSIQISNNNNQSSRNINNNFTVNKNSKLIEEKKNTEQKKFNGDFMKDIYDNFLLPGADNKYNYTVHKIFLSHVLEKVCKKMVEIRAKNNKVITKEEIRKEYCNEVDNLRNSIITGQDYNIINKVYNINNNLNIISIDLGRNYLKFNDMGIIDESQEGNLKNTSIDDRDKDKQDLTLNILSQFDKSHISEINKKQTLESIETKYKKIHKKNNDELLSNIKDTMNLSNQSFSIHDSFINLYFKKIKLNSTKYRNNITSNKFYLKKKMMHSRPMTKRSYFEEEDELNNVEKFILNTKKIRYALNIKEKKDERNLSFDSEGNIKNYFEVGMKLNPVFFDDIYDQLREQYNKNNNIKEKYEKNEMVKEILKFYMYKKGINLKFNEPICKKYLSLIIPKSKKKIDKNQTKIKYTEKNKAKQEKKIIQDISKLMHKKINIKKGKFISVNENTKKKTDKHRKNRTEDNFYQKNMTRNINKEFYSIKSNNEKILLTENNYIEMETNSSEFSDLPSELDSEIFEMIKKKQEQKNREAEEGIYASQTGGTKRKGGDFIITKPQNKKKEKKEEEKKLNDKEKKEEEDKDDKGGNLNLFLDKDERGEIDEKKKEENIKKKEEKTNEKNILKKKLIEDIRQKNKSIEKSKLNEDNNLDKKNKEISEKSKQKNDTEKNKNKNIVNKKITKSTSDITENKTSHTTKTRKDDTTSILSPSKKQKNETEEKETFIKKQAKKKTEKKPKEGAQSSKKEKQKQKNADIEIPDLINKNKIKQSDEELLYNNIKINKNNISTENDKSIDNKDSKENPEFSLNNDIKNISPTLEDKNINNINDSSKNPTSDHLSMVGVMNAINLKQKINKSNIKNNEEESKEKSDMSNISHEDEEITKAKEKKNTSFYNESRNNKILMDIIITEEKKIQKHKRGSSPIIDQSKNYVRIIQFLEKYKKENIKYKNEIKKREKTQKDNDTNSLQSNATHDSFEEEIDEKREERRKRKTRKTKGVDVRQFFFDENIIKDIEKKEKKISEKLPLIFPKREPWEGKFKNFKLYINKLKGMNQDEFKYDLFKFLHEEEKIDFSQKEKLNMVDRINKYKAFINNSKKNKLLYNKFHSSRILFTPGCIFNTDNIF